jgi:hypothetical protein
MTQTIEYVVKVNAAQAQAAIADVEKRFGGVDTVVARLDKNLINLERDIKDLNAAIAAGGPNVEHYKRQLADLTSAVGGGGGGGRRNLGMATLEASRGLEDLQYGIGGVVNNIPSLVMALGIGAGATGVISILAVGINQAWKATEEFRKELAENEKTLTSWIGVIEAAARANSDKLNKSLGETASLLRETQEELRNYGKTDGQIKIARAEQELAENERTRDRMGLQVEERKQRAQTLEDEIKRRMNQRGNSGELIAEMRDQAKMERALADAAATRTKELDSGIAKQRTEVAIIKGNVAALEALEKAETKRGRRGASSIADPLLAPLTGDAMFDDSSFAGTNADVDARAREARNEAADRAYDARAKLNADRMNAEIAAEKDKAQRIADNEEMFANMRYEQAKAARQQELDAQAAFVMEWTGIGVDALQTYLDAKIKGEENAEALMAASLMRTAGQALIGHGINLAGAAVVSAGTGLLPVAAAQAAGAAGLIAGGIALGATATGIEHVAAGGALGKPLDDKSGTRDKGASPRSSSGGGSGGPMIVNVSYGAGGPLPEDIAREIHKVTSSGNRRRGAA